MSRGSEKEKKKGKEKKRKNRHGFFLIIIFWCESKYLAYCLVELGFSTYCATQKKKKKKKKKKPPPGQSPRPAKTKKKHFKLKGSGKKMEKKKNKKKPPPGLHRPPAKSIKIHFTLKGSGKKMERKKEKKKKKVTSPSFKKYPTFLSISRSPTLGSHHKLLIPSIHR